MSEVADLELCRELYELSGWKHTTDHRRIEKVWIESFSTSEMGMGHDDYDKTPPAERRQYHVGEYVVRDNPRNMIGIPEDVPWGWANKYWNETVERSVPAYTLGYLVRKLPERHHVAHKIETITLNPFYEVTIREKNGTKGAHIIAKAMGDTPENAAAALAIELFKQGVLTRKDGNA